MEGKPKAVRVRYKFCGAKESERDDNESYWEIKAADLLHVVLGDCPTPRCWDIDTLH